MDIIFIPPSLVLGCNNQVSANALCDFVEETTGHPLDLIQSGYSDGIGHLSGSGFGSGYGYGNNAGLGFGSGYEHINSRSYLGQRISSGNGYGFGRSFDCYYGDSTGNGTGSSVDDDNN